MLISTLQPAFSWTTLFLLVLIFLASLATYTLVVLRWTTRRQWVSLAEWAGGHRMKIARQAPTDLPPPLDKLRDVGALVRLRVANSVTTILQIQTGDDADASANRWNLLIRQSPRLHSPAALRPEHVSASLFDQFDLTAFHSLSTARFAVLAVDVKTAQKMINSPARALLPPDVGLLVVGAQIVLDFSTRPFDPVELDRIMSVANQIVEAV